MPDWPRRADVSAIQVHVDALLKILDERIGAGQLVVHFDRFQVQKVEICNVRRVGRRAEDLKHLPARTDTVR